MELSIKSSLGGAGGARVGQSGAKTKEEKHMRVDDI